MKMADLDDIINRIGSVRLELDSIMEELEKKVNDEYTTTISEIQKT